MAQQDTYFRWRSRRKIFKIFWFFCSLAIFAGLGYFLVFSKYFLVKDVLAQIDPSVGEAGDSDKQQIAEFVRQELEDKNFGIIPGNNILFLNKDGLASALLKKHVFYKAFKVDYRFENQTLIVSGQARKAVALACLDADCYSVDEDGIAFYAVGSYATTDESLLFTVDKETGKEVVLGSLFLPKKLVDFAAEFKKLADSEGVGVKRAVIEKEYPEAHFVKFITRQGWYILTIFDFDPENVVENMKLVMGKEIKGRREDLEYIDLRYNDKAYYKLR